MKIILDQDQVLCQWTERILEWYNKDYGTNLTVNDVKDWHLASVMGDRGRDFIRSCMRWPEFYTRLEPVPGAIDGVKKLIDMGHEVRIVSAVPKSSGIAYHGKCQWLRDFMPFFDLDNFYAVHHKEEVEGDLLLDDGGHNIEPWVKKGRIAVVFDCPWNQQVKGTYRVKNWPHFLELIEHLRIEAEVVAEREKNRPHSMFDEAFAVR